MANKKNNAKKSMTSRNKSTITLCVLLALTVFLSVIGIIGMPVGDEGARILLPWMPVRKNMQAYDLSLSLGGGTGIDYTLTAVQTAEEADEPEEEAAEATVEEATEAPEGTEEATEEAAAETTEETATQETTEQTAEAGEETTQAELPDGAADTFISVMQARLKHYGFEGVTFEKVDNATIHVEMPYTDQDTILESIFASSGVVEFVDADGNVLAGNEAITNVQANSRYGSATDGNNYYFYNILFDLTGDFRETLKALGEDADVTMLLDGSSVGVTLYAEGQNGFTLNATKQYDAETMNQVKLWASVLSSDAVPYTISHDHSSETEVEAKSPALYSALLIALWAVFACLCIVMIFSNHAAGLASAWTLWVYMLFFFFLMATVTLVTMTTPVWIACIVGVCLAGCTCILQLREMDDAVLSGRDALSAVRTGFHTSVKTVWIVNGCALVLSLLLMIAGATRPIGYTLATSVVCSIAACIGLIRWNIPVMVSSFGARIQNVSRKTAHQ